MTNDTMKSLGYLKKSLKMTKRALEKNKAQDDVDPIELDNLNRTIEDLEKSIVVFEALNPVSVAAPVSPTAVNPTPAPSTIDTDDDLLTT
jgi:hypothetical protein